MLTDYRDDALTDGKLYWGAMRAGDRSAAATKQVAIFAGWCSCRSRWSGEIEHVELGETSGDSPVANYDVDWLGRYRRVVRLRERTIHPPLHDAGQQVLHAAWRARSCSIASG